MDERTRLTRVERQLALLEAQLRELRIAVGLRPDESSKNPLEGVKKSAPFSSPDVVHTPGPVARTGPPAASTQRASKDVERWLGENALLVVGLLALVATAGFLLKYAFDQGWISPGLRVIAGLVAGAGLAGYGERAQRGGLGRYGEALVGGGGAIAYLSIWAAAGPYQFVSSQWGIAALAVLSGLIIYRAAARAAQFLASIAGVGAFMAPIILGDAGGSANFLVAYSAAVAVGTGAVAVRHRWQATFGLAILGFFLLPAELALEFADRALTTTYLVLGGLTALVVTRRRGWVWLQAGAFFLAWSLLADVASDVEAWRAWLLVLLLPGLVAPSFLDYLQASAEAVEQDPEPTPALETFGGFVERLPVAWWGYLLASAGAWAWVTVRASPEPFSGSPLLFLAIISIPYLVLSIARQVPGVGAIGFGLLAWGVAIQMDGHGMTVGWASLALLSAITNYRVGMAEGRWIGPGLGILAAYQHMTLGVVDRPATEHAFFGSWSLVLYVLIGTFAALAGPLSGQPPAEGSAHRLKGLRPTLWIGAGLLLLWGGTQEIVVHFLGAPDAGELVRDLTVSAFWLVYAGLLIGYGFWREKQGVRLGGLAVTALAILKVTFFDLTRLEALYRVAAFGLLAAIALLAANAYHRRSRDTGGST